MEYIQCTHCSKKYGINDKVRAAAGRSIACKGCGESFEIVIFETPSPSMPEKNQAAAKNEILEPTAKEAKNNNPQPERQETNSTQSEHKKTKVRQTKTRLKDAEKKKLSPSMLLGVAIIAISVYMFYQDRSVDIGQPFVATEMPKPNPKPIEHVALAPEEVVPASAPKAFIHQELSEACKDIAAQQWVIDYTMMHGIPEKSEYVRMLDEGVQNTAEIREKCGSSSIVQEVLATATKGVPPKWLEMHVSALITLGKETPHF